MRLATASFLAAGLVGFLMAAAGCQNGPTDEERGQLQYFKKSYERECEYGLPMAAALPDIITIHAPKAPEIDNIKQPIGPDGTLNLDLLQRVYVAGMSPQEVEKLLAEKLRTYYQDVKVRVGGRLQEPVVLRFRRGDQCGVEALHGAGHAGAAALAEARRSRGLAWPERIYVIKPSADPEQRHITVINLNDVLKRGDAGIKCAAGAG